MSRGEDENINQAIKNSFLALNAEGKNMPDEADDIARDLAESLKVSRLQSSSTSTTRDKKQTQQSCEACGTLESVHANFWGQKLCLQHRSDSSNLCFACHRYKLMGMRFVNTNDGRKICTDCYSVATLDSQKAKVMFNKVHEFYKELKINVDKNVPFFLVDQFDMEETVHGKGETQGKLKSMGCTVFSSIVIKSVTSSSLIGETIEVEKKAEILPEGKVTGMLVLYGYSVLETGCTLAHEMMHAWLSREGYRKFDRKLEEGICQVMGFKWIDWYDFKADKSFSYTSEQIKFLENLKRSIKRSIELKSDEIYGDGFRDVKKAVDRFGLEYTFNFIDNEMRLPDTKPAQEKTENKMLITPFQNLKSLVNKLYGRLSRKVKEFSTSHCLCSTT